MSTVSLSIRPISSLVGVPSSLVGAYGVKAAGCVKLLGLQPGSPVHYRVPDAYAIPPRSKGGAGRDGARHAYRGLTAHMRRPGVLMARSSAIDELPGLNPTKSVKFDPTDDEASFKRFEAAVEEVQSLSDDMGVVAMAMVGGLSTLEGLEGAFGLENISFVADSHSPFHPQEMHLALVHGLGTRAVEGEDDAIAISVLRKDDTITHFGNRSERYALAGGFSESSVVEIGQYRQWSADYFSMESGEIESAYLDDLIRRISQTALRLSLGKFDDKWGNAVGISPIGSVGMYNQLTGVLHYLSQELGPVQIEGAYPRYDSDELNLYQLLEVPEKEVSATPITIENPNMVSSDVIGKIDFQGPLVWMTTDQHGSRASLTWPQVEFVRRLDRDRFAESGYIFLAWKHSVTNMGLEGTIDNAPNCRIRLSINHEDDSSHATTLTRIRAARFPNQGYHLSSLVKGVSNEPPMPPRPDEQYEGIYIYRNAHIQSNGEQMALEILRDENERPNLLTRFGRWLIGR